eukprot:6160619-Amphidinium_carterae.2
MIGKVNQSRSTWLTKPEKPTIARRPLLRSTVCLRSICQQPMRTIGKCQFNELYCRSDTLATV